MAPRFSGLQCEVMGIKKPLQLIVARAYYIPNNSYKFLIIPVK